MGLPTLLGALGAASALARLATPSTAADRARGELSDAVGAYLASQPVETLHVQPASVPDGPREDFDIRIDRSWPSRLHRVDLAEPSLLCRAASPPARRSHRSR